MGQQHKTTVYKRLVDVVSRLTITHESAQPRMTRRDPLHGMYIVCPQYEYGMYNVRIPRFQVIIMALVLASVSPSRGVARRGRGWMSPIRYIVST